MPYAPAYLNSSVPCACVYLPFCICSSSSSHNAMVLMLIRSSPRLCLRYTKPRNDATRSRCENLRRVLALCVHAALLPLSRSGNLYAGQLSKLISHSIHLLNQSRTLASARTQANPAPPPRSTAAAAAACPLLYCLHIVYCFVVESTCIRHQHKFQANAKKCKILSVENIVVYIIRSITLYPRLYYI